MLVQPRTMAVAGLLIGGLILSLMRNVSQQEDRLVGAHGRDPPPT